MGSTGTFEVAPQAAPGTLRTLGAWAREAWRLFRGAPLAGLALSLAPIAVEGALQMIPVAGLVLSKVLTPLAGAWALCVLHQRAMSGAFALRDATRLWMRRLPVLLGLVPLALLVSAWQMGTLWLLAGFDQVRAVLTLDAAALALTRPQIALMLASGMLPALPLSFAVMQGALSGRGVLDSVRDSVAAVWRLRSAMLVLGGVSVAVLLALPWCPWLLAIHLPMALYLGYASWADAFGDVSLRQPA